MKYDILKRIEENKQNWRMDDHNRKLHHWTLNHTVLKPPLNRRINDMKSN